ncbi:hypothetical protein N7501_002586, partial [Penicillium viridicatum]
DYDGAGYCATNGAVGETRTREHKETLPSRQRKEQDSTPHTPGHPECLLCRLRREETVTTAVTAMSPVIASQDRLCVIKCASQGGAALPSSLQETAALPSSPQGHLRNQESPQGHLRHQESPQGGAASTIEPRRRTLREQPMSPVLYKCARSAKACVAASVLSRSSSNVQAPLRGARDQYSPA